MLIAIASSDGITVNEHFGRAEKFLIYRITDKAPDFVEERTAIPYSAGPGDHEFDEERFARTAAALSGCARLYTCRIGDAPAAALRGMGIEPVVCSSRITDIGL